MISEITKRARKTKKKILAIPTAAPAMPPNPSIAAMIATTKNVILQRNMIPSYFFRERTTPTRRTMAETRIGT